MTLDEFWRRVSVDLRLEGVPVTRETSLRDELEFDSLQMMELGIVLDELGAELPEDMIPYIETVGDLYDHYVTRTEAEMQWK
jgi:acyl carrier protein